MHDIVKIQQMISKVWNGAKVENVIIDKEFDAVTATINGKINIDCGWLEDYKINGNYYHEI
jgi:hypothetical protein